MMAIDSSNTNCVLCDKTFGCQSNLDFHIKTIHLRMLVCDKCPDFSTLIKIRMERHYKNVHQSKMPIVLPAGPSYPKVRGLKFVTDKGSKFGKSNNEVEVITIPEDKPPAKAGLAKLAQNTSITVTSSIPKTNTKKIIATVIDADADIEMADAVSSTKHTEISPAKMTDSGAKGETNSTPAVEQTNSESKPDSNPSELTDEMMMDEENAESSSFNCDKCWNVFETKEELSEHVLEMHNIARTDQIEEVTKSNQDSAKESSQKPSEMDTLSKSPTNSTQTGSDKIMATDTTNTPSMDNDKESESTLKETAPAEQIKNPDCPTV
jgi:hypothetical protein